MSNKIQSSKVFEVEQLIKAPAAEKNSENIIQLFESIDETYRDQHAQHLYLELWKIALINGKLNQANRYAQKGVDFLIELKRVPYLKKFLDELKKNGLLKKNQKKVIAIIETITGKKKIISSEDLDNFNILMTHPDHWKSSLYFLSQYLSMENDWKGEQWKHCYEYILNFYFDRELFLILSQKAVLLGKQKYHKLFENFLLKNNVRFTKDKILVERLEEFKNEKLNVDYDQLAYELLSGAIDPSLKEQDKVISSLKFLSDSELESKGLEMILAFEFLGMEKVVLVLCQRLLPLLSETKKRASCYFVWAQNLVSRGEYYKALDLIEEILNTEPIYGDELLAFVYLRAESYFNLNKFRLAHEIYLGIKKIKTNYRLTRERIAIIEANK